MPSKLAVQLEAVSPPNSKPRLTYVYRQGSSTMPTADLCPHSPSKSFALLDRGVDTIMTEQGDDLPITEKARPLSLANVESRPLPIEFQPATPKTGTTVASLLEKHRKFMEAWKLSAAYRNTCNLFNEALLQNQRMEITTCMCLCLGSKYFPR